MKKFLTTPILLVLFATAYGDDLVIPDSIPLWSKGAPGSEARADEPEKIDNSSKGKHNVSNIHNPSITPFLPTAEKATGTAILVAPGGGHRVLCLGHEGYTIAQWLADRGVAAFVLKNRLAREEGSSYTIEGHAMADTRRALRMIRSRAKEWKIDPARIGVMGFSAGGELAAFASMKFDSGKAGAEDLIEREGCRPAFQALIYPGSSRLFTVGPDSPPVFLACGYNDRPDISKGLAELYLKYKEAKIPADLHIFANAGHGFGFRAERTNGAGRWPERMMDWLNDNGLLKKK